ncbi:GNAT family N-acetyltransferase [Salinarimonas sp.]|uniref:GNAT family N-acetyltransferase n=1 Tax=Salinarimonas sp. TaxID=2766526 RepID=UPI0032D979C2
MFAFSSAGAPNLSLIPGGGRRRVTPPPPLPRFKADDCEIEVRGALDLDAAAPAWAGLAKRALAPSPFCEHAFLAAAARHLPEGRHLDALLVWRGETLIGVAPVVGPRLGAPLRRLAPWRADLLPAATPLIDRDAAPRALGALLAFAGERRVPLILGDVPAGSALAEALVEKGLRVLTPPRTPTPDPAPEAPAAAGLDVAVARSAGEIRDAVEIFLALDAETARARRALALVQDPGRANLVRTATRRAAREKACRVHVARRDGRPVAAIVVARGMIWLSAEAADAPGAVAALVARARVAPAPPCADWTSAPPPSARRPGARAAELVAAARRLLSPLSRAS